MSKELSMGYVTSIQTQTQIDENGEVKSYDEKKITRFPKEPPFIKIYLDNILYLSDLPTGLNGILMALLKRMSYAQDGQKLYVNSAMKRDILKELHPRNPEEKKEDWEERIKKMSLKNIDNALTNFVKGKILFRPETGLYIFNPDLFGKGEWVDIAKIRLNVEFTMEGKTFKAQIDKSNIKTMESTEGDG